MGKTVRKRMVGKNKSFMCIIISSINAIQVLIVIKLTVLISIKT